MSEDGGPAEWLRDLRGLPAYILCVYTPLDRISARSWFALLPFAGDWAYRDVRRDFAKARVSKHQGE